MRNEIQENKYIEMKGKKNEKNEQTNKKTHTHTKIVFRYSFTLVIPSSETYISKKKAKKAKNKQTNKQENTKTKKHTHCLRISSFFCVRYPVARNLPWAPCPAGWSGGPLRPPLASAASSLGPAVEGLRLKVFLKNQRAFSLIILFSIYCYFFFVYRTFVNFLCLFVCDL